MELLVLIILYYLSQNPDFERSVKPLLSELKNSEKALNFLGELSQFSNMFSQLNGKKGGGMSGTNAKSTTEQSTQKQTEPQNNGNPFQAGQNPQSATPSPTSDIADRFIEELLSKYFHAVK